MFTSEPTVEVPPPFSEEQLAWLQTTFGAMPTSSGAANGGSSGGAADGGGDSGDASSAVLRRAR
jgi:hypothetical protein